MSEVAVIDKMLPADWKQVEAIYLEGIETGHATFQKEAPSWNEWDNSHLQICRLVARHQGKILGWAALSPVSSRCVYKGVAEVSIYVSKASIGKGIGTRLLQFLIETSERNEIWTLQSGIFPENASSLQLHYNCGFREVGKRERIGKMDGVWRDVKLLERRSNLAGIE